MMSATQGRVASAGRLRAGRLGADQLRAGRHGTDRLRAGLLLGLGLGLGGGLGGGCGLVSSDVASVMLDLPTKKYAFDTASTGYHGPPGTLPEVACGSSGPVTDCCNPAPGVTVDCAATPLTCEGVCTYHTTFEVVSTVDLGKDAPQFSQFSGQAILNLSLSKVTYTAVNGLNVPSPPIDIYLAPANVVHVIDPATQTMDPAVAKFGSVASVPAGATVTADVQQAPGCAGAFAKYAKDFATPFNFIATAPITVKGGDPIPAGKLEVTVSGQAKIKPNL